MKKGLNNDGFTLVELLAIMVILGVLLMVAIPQVTRTISDSRKEVFVDTAVAFLSSAKTGIVNGSYTQEVPIDPTFSVCIPFNQIEYEKGSKSPFGSAIDTKSSYVKVYNDNGKIRYYVFMRDQKDHFLGPIEESAISAATKKTKLVFNKSRFATTNMPFPNSELQMKRGSYKEVADIIFTLGSAVTKEADPAGICTYLVEPVLKVSEQEAMFAIYDPTANDGAGAIVAPKKNDDGTWKRNAYTGELEYETGNNTPYTRLKEMYENANSKSYAGYHAVKIGRENELDEHGNPKVDERGNPKLIDKMATPYEAYLAHQLPAKLKEGISTEEEEEEEEDW